MTRDEIVKELREAVTLGPVAICCEGCRFYTGVRDEWCSLGVDYTCPRSIEAELMRANRRVKEFLEVRGDEI